MDALWLEDRQLRLCGELPVPQPSPDEALVRIRLAGICATDLELIKGYYPYTGVPGHEFVGDIVQAPAAPERAGERVVGSINAACGQCGPCQNGRPTHCERRTVLGIKNRHGAFAEYLCLPLRNLLTVSDAIADEQAVFAEPLAAALEIQEQIPVRPSDDVLIVGAGRLGQLIAQTLKLTGCRLQVIARHQKQRALLQSNRIDWLDEHSVQQRSFDRVIEATGSPDGFALARQAVRPCGTIVLKSTYQGDTSINLSSLVVDEIRLVGSRCGPMRPALRLLERQLVNPTPLIDARYPLVRALAAFEQAARPGVLKVLVEMRNGAET